MEKIKNRIRPQYEKRLKARHKNNHMPFYIPEGGEHMGIALSMLLNLFIHLTHLNNAGLTTQAQVENTDEVTPTSTPTDTPSVTPTIMPTSIPSITPTETPMPTVLPTVTPTSTLTVTPSNTPTEDGDKDDMFDLKADVHALFGLMNAAWHHERNEQRFDAKHGVMPTGEAEGK